MLMSTYLGVIGRVLLQNTSFFSLLLNQMACESGQEVRMFLLVFQLDCIQKSHSLNTKELSPVLSVFILPQSKHIPFLLLCSFS